QCPVGTYLVDFECINCEIGSYQPLTGQTECFSCPSGNTTATFGSSDISECSVKISNETDSHHDDDSDDDKKQVDTDNYTTVTIIVVTCVVVVLVVLIVGSSCLRKHLKKNDRAITVLVEGAGDYTDTQADPCRSPYNTDMLTIDQADLLSLQVTQSEANSRSFGSQTLPVVVTKTVQEI
ncbi:signal peptide, CUB and EGF-like domain-containing protein 1, partial [Ruditapes philippinarum]|uniref:signal peptide, CUB and EGF-like domain-containing protein 1 n=1 Tax=Ruditapes philippinarum TaxID=129788 RepID=UPI00295C34D9